MTFFESIPSNLKFALSFFIFLMVGIAGFLYFVRSEQQRTLDSITFNTSMEITSTAFTDGGLIPQKYTCNGDNVNPPLTFSGVPSQSVSLVLLMDDPDVPTDLRPDGNFDHWVAFNIPPKKAGIAEGTNPGQSIIGKNSRGENAYTGPCPPDREHRYFFKLYALDIKLDLDRNATKQDVLNAMEGHIDDQAVLMGRYDQPRE